MYFAERNVPLGGGVVEASSTVGALDVVGVRCGCGRRWQRSALRDGSLRRTGVPQRVDEFSVLLTPVAAARLLRTLNAWQRLGRMRTKVLKLSACISISSLLLFFTPGRKIPGVKN